MENGKPVLPPATSGKATASLVLGVMSFCFAVLTGLPALILGAVALLDIDRSQGRLQGRGLAIAGMVLGCFGIMWSCVTIALLLPAIQAAREAARRQKSSNNLKVIGLAMHNYHDCYKSFPLAGSNDPEYGLQQSWRVRLLPFIEHGPLFDRFDFREPWDSPNNRAIIEEMPETYRSPNRPQRDPRTVYLAVASSGPQDRRGENGQYFPIFQQSPPRRISFVDIKDGTANTVMVVEANADQAALWTKPDDWMFDPKNPRQGLGQLRPGGFLTLFADGSVRFLSNSTDDDTLRRLFSRADGERIQYQMPPR